VAKSGINGTDLAHPTYQAQAARVERSERFVSFNTD
jgi:hypothetical protein